MAEPLFVAFGLGFRHGADLDHLAAITDLTSSAASRAEGFRLATLYASGHALVLSALGVGAVALGALVPQRIGDAVGRFVGVTLIALGMYVLWGVFRKGRDFVPTSRYLFAWRRLHLFMHKHEVPHTSGRTSAFAIGMAHGVGAETPTQMLLLATAAGSGALVVVPIFVGGLFAMNTLLATAAALGYSSFRGSLAYPVACVTTAAFSIYLGVGYLTT